MTQKIIYKFLLPALLLPLFLSACGGGLKKQIGLEKSAPDEFAVISRAPLELPPDYNLNPSLPVPQLGVQRPQEASVEQSARQSVFSNGTPRRRVNSSSAEGILLERSGANPAQGEIRNVVDQEAAKGMGDKRSVAEKLTGVKIGKGKANVIDPQEEWDAMKASKVQAQQSENAVQINNFPEQSGDTEAQ